MPGAELTRDESIRDGVTLEPLARLKPAFRKRRHGHRRQLLPLNDGAAALLVADEAGAAASSAPSRWPGSPPRGVDAVEPQLFGIGPVEAGRPGAGQGRPASARAT